MWILFITNYLILASSNALKLIGDHVCQQEERYSVNVTQYFLRNATVRSYQWCMRIPPRCSTFTHRTINASRIVEEERTKHVPMCCIGYEPDASGENCIPQCADCINGVCNEEHKCYCNPGYRGDHCEKACEFARWGRYCRYHCTCERGSCNPLSGHCECPNGWTGARCEQQCTDGYYGLQCKNICQCRVEELCNPTDGRCISKDKIAGIFGPKSPYMKKYHTFDVSMLSPKKATNTTDEATLKKKPKQKIVDLYLLITTERFETTFINDNDTTLDITTAPTAYETSFEITSSQRTTTNIVNLEEATKSESTTREEEQSTTTQLYETLMVSKSAEVNTLNGVDVNVVGIDIKSTDHSVDLMKRDALKGKAVVEVSGSREASSGQETARPLDVVHQQGSLSPKRIVGVVATGVSVFVLILFLGFYTSLKMLDRKSKAEDSKCRKEITASVDGSSSFSSKSIFHFPLPDPPAVENMLSTFSAKTVKQQVTSSDSSTDYLGLFYDHPPSTGSYRAASIPEPPPATNLYKVPQLILEPIYDEIPSCNQANQESVYINTLMEDITKF